MSGDGRGKHAKQDQQLLSDHMKEYDLHGPSFDPKDETFIDPHEQEAQDEHFPAEDPAGSETRDTLLETLRAKLNIRIEDMIAHMDKHVKGQQEAKFVLACTFFMHLYRILNNNTTGETYKKSNILILGPTGVGKTLLVKTLADFVGLPFAKGDATEYSESGYIGRSVTSVLKDLVEAAGGIHNKGLAENGIVYIDEIDKLRAQDSGFRDVKGKGIQHSLLKMVEDNEVAVNERERNIEDGPEFKIDTTNVLFIVSGAFSDMELPQERTSIGFASPESVDSTNGSLNILNTSLIDYGFSPEFVGRFPVKVLLGELTEPQIVEILKKDNSVLAQYKALFAANGKTLEFTDEAIDVLAHQVYLLRLGGRGVDSICEQLLATMILPKLEESDPHICVDRILLEQSIAKFDRLNISNLSIYKRS